MQQHSLLGRILRLLPAVPVVLFHIVKELVQDLVKFVMRPHGVAWPDPSAATWLG
jgi:hypothetical protein